MTTYLQKFPAEYMNERIMKTISIWRSYVKNFRVYVLSCHRVVHTPGTLYGDVSTAHKHGDAVHVCGEVRQISRYTRQRQVPSDVRLISAHMNDESDQIRSSVNSSRNLQQTDCHIAHHTLNVLLHYLVKWQLSQTAIFI